MTTHEWKDIASAPEGVRILLKRDDCPGYDTKGCLMNGEWQTDWFFIRGDRTMHRIPTHWAPLPSLPAPPEG